MQNIKQISGKDFGDISKKLIESFTSSYGDQVKSFRLLKSTDDSYLFELTLIAGTKHERLVIATHDILPISIILSDYDKYFDKSPELDRTKSIQIAKFDDEQNLEDTNTYGYNPDLIS